MTIFKVLYDLLVKGRELCVHKFWHDEHFDIMLELPQVFSFFTLFI